MEAIIYEETQDRFIISLDKKIMDKSEIIEMLKVFRLNFSNEPSMEKKQKPSDFVGMFSADQAKQYAQQITEERESWEQAI